MGWAQRTRCGGGTPRSTPGIITILRVLIGDVNDGTVVVEFSAPVTAAQFNPGDMSDDTVGAGADVVGQALDNSLVYQSDNWTDLIAVGDTWTFSDAVAGVATPQSGVIVAP